VRLLSFCSQALSWFRAVTRQLFGDANLWPGTTPTLITSRSSSWCDAVCPNLPRNGRAAPVVATAPQPTSFPAFAERSRTTGHVFVTAHRFHCSGHAVDPSEGSLRLQQHSVLSPPWPCPLRFNAFSRKCVQTRPCHICTGGAHRLHIFTRIGSPPPTIDANAHHPVPIAHRHRPPLQREGSPLPPILWHFVLRRVPEQGQMAPKASISDLCTGNAGPPVMPAHLVEPVR
jgi:hypothetical protein